MPIILSFCIPMLLGNIFQQLYNMADALIVGRFLGLDELSGVVLTGPLTFLVLGFVLGITTGFCIPVAQSFGSGDVSEMRRYAANAFYLCLFFTALLTAATMVFTYPLLELMQTPDGIIDHAFNYIIVIFGGIIVIMFYNFFASLLRALGDSKTPLYFLVVASVINVILDLVFILVFGMGTEGAAWATVIAQAVSVLLCVIFIKKNYPVLVFKKGELALSMSKCWRLIVNGVPMALQFSITAIGSIILQWAVNGLGEIVIASVAISGKIQLLVMQPMETLGITMATYSAQNLGAGKLLRIKKGIKLSLFMVIGYSIVALCVVAFAGQYIALLFMKPDEPNKAEVLKYITQFLRCNGIFYWILGILFILRNSLQGLGYSAVTMLAGVSELAARTIVATVFAAMFGFSAICFASPAAWFMAVLMLVIAFFIIMHRLNNKTRKELKEKVKIKEKVNQED